MLQHFLMMIEFQGNKEERASSEVYEAGSKLGNNLEWLCCALMRKAIWLSNPIVLKLL